MPRRAPPTALRLVSGPTPPRGVPRHTLPSMPHPTFQPSASISRGPVPRGRASELPSGTSQPTGNHLLSIELSMHLPPLSMSTFMVASEAGRRSPASTISSSSNDKGKFLRGPWDHSKSISVPLDVETLIAPPKPAAVSPGSGSGWMMV